jgi:glucose-6-phosphate 1-epimerase
MLAGRSPRLGVSHTPLPAVALESPDGARAEVALHGGHVLSWRTPDGRERLFLSERAVYREGAAIRGGVPVIFPQFADVGPLPRHGFARGTAWALAEADDARAVLRLVDSEATRAVWPHAFAAELTVALAEDALAMTLAVANVGDAPFAFTGALHTYLRVGDAARATVRGLRGVRYRDQTAGGAERRDGDDALAVRGEVDRVYLDAPSAVELWEGEARSLAVRMDGFRDAVVWNPGIKADALSDLAPGDAARFVCVEAAVVAAPVVVAPGERWVGAQRLTAG